MSQRREFFREVGARSLCGLALPALFASPAGAQARQRVSMSLPGPGNLLYLPLYLAPLIEADAAEGLALDLRFVGGGPLAMKQMLDRNSDFSAAGLAAAALQRLCYAASFVEAMLKQLNAALHRSPTEMARIASLARDQAQAETAQLLRSLPGEAGEGTRL